MTAAERLQSLAGTTGTAAALLLLIGSGSTAGAALVNYSGLDAVSASTHILADRVAPTASLGAWGGTEPKKKKKRKPEDEIVAVSPEPISAAAVSRLREEMLSASVADDVEQRAKARLKRMRAEDEALLLMIS